MIDPKNTTLDGLFPTSKVIAGFDFVGSSWPNGPLAPDPDPIAGRSHGTHVADIIGGTNGVAPGASLIAVKVCSEVTDACSGVALLQGIDYAASLNVDIINMSLGSGPFGQIQDPLYEGIINLVASGIIVVASAGNNGDRPYIVQSPASHPSVIAVAETGHPLDVLDAIQAGSQTIWGTYQRWSGLRSFLTGPLTYNQASTATRQGCGDGSGSNPYTPGSLAGKVLLVDRGTCALSLKVSNASDAGAIAVLQADNQARPQGELAPTFTYGGGDAGIPAWAISFSNGIILKSGTPSIGFDPNDSFSLANNINPFSSRGPSFEGNAIKPDIAAPGANFSAEKGTGTGQSIFGGTSGSAPMVSGAIALLLDANPNLSYQDVRAILLNSARNNITTNPVTGILATPVQIGGGLIQVDQARLAPFSVVYGNTSAPTVSLGNQHLTKKGKFIETFSITNYIDQNLKIDVRLDSRSSTLVNDAVDLKIPSEITVNANSSKTLDVKVKVDPKMLPSANLNGGIDGGNGPLVSSAEYTGYLLFTNPNSNYTASLPFYGLFQPAANVQTKKDSIQLNSNGQGEITLKNKKGARNGTADIFALTGTSPDDTLIENFFDMSAVGIRAFNSNGTDLLQWGFTLYLDRSHPDPVGFEIHIDANRDGTDDYTVFNSDLGGLTTGDLSGENAVFVFDGSSSGLHAFFYADTGLNSANMILTVPMSAVGLTPDDTFDFHVCTRSAFTGEMMDSIGMMTHTPSMPRFSSPLFLTLPIGGKAKVSVNLVPGGDTASPSQTGLLFLYRNQEFQADLITVNQKQP